MKKILLNIYFWYFGICAKIFLFRHKSVVIGTTGSIGKTSCRMIIYDILKTHLPDKKVYTSSKNFNGELGLSLSILGISDYIPNCRGVLKTVFNAFKKSLFGKKIYDVVILEYGIDHIGEMDFLLKIVKPDYAVVTKIDKVHSSQFGGKEITASEKYKLLINTKNTVFLNKDDEFSIEYSKKINSKKLFYTTAYTTDLEGLDLVGKNYVLEKVDNIPYVKYNFNYIGVGNLDLYSNLIGKENIGYTNIGFVILADLYQKFYQKDFFSENKSEIKMNFELQNSRFTTFKGINNSILVDGTYNAAPFSMKTFIENVEVLKRELYSDYKSIYCIGDMRELGDYTQEEHKKLANFIKDKPDLIFFVGESTKKYVIPKLLELGFGEEKIRHFDNSKILGENLADYLLNSDEKYLILFKGSQNTIFLEESVKAVLNDKNEVTKLCRQEEYWMNNKNKFFEKE